MNVDEAASELYGRPLAEFVDARNELAKRAKTEGANEAATSIKAMRKPTVAAWVINQLVRASRSDVEDLVALGEQMRTATAESDGAKLRELTAERRAVIDTLQTAAKRIAIDAGQQAGDVVVAAVNMTLMAAVADPRAGLEVLTGCLAKPLEHVGFGPLPTGEPAEVISLSAARAARTSNVTAPSRAAKKTTSKKAEVVDPREAALSELEAAEADLENAETRVEQLRTAFREIRERVATAEATVERLTTELHVARKELDDAETDAETVEDQLEQARKDVEAASRRRRDARLEARRFTR